MRNARKSNVGRILRHQIRMGRHLRSFLLGSAALLTVTFALSGESTAQSLTTTFAGGNNYAGNMFDVQVLGGAIIVTGLDVHLGSGIAPTSTINVYTRPGSFVGFDDSETGWNLMSSISVVSAGAGNPTFIDVADFELAGGQTAAFYVTVSDYPSAPLHYTNGTGVGNVSVENDDLRIFEGVGKGDPNFTGSTPSPRIWNGTIYYTLGPILPIITDAQIAAELTLQAAEQGVMLSDAQSRAIVNQLRGRVSASGIDSANTASLISAFADDGPTQAETTFAYAIGNGAVVGYGNWTAWADTSADGIKGDWNPDVDGYQVRQQFGLDYRFANGWVAGVGIGGGAFDNDFSNGGELSGSAFWVQPYVGMDVGGWLVALQAAYTYTDYETFDTGLGMTDSAHGHRISGSATVSREFALGNGFYIMPEAAISGGTESFSDLLDLTSPPATVDDASFFNTRFGGEASYRFASSGRAYALAFAEYTSTSGDGAESYLSTGYLADRWSATLGGGVDLELGDTKRLGVEGRVRGIGSDTLIYGASARFSIGF